MHHSITFGGKNTWDDWHLIPDTVPIINPPPPKIKKLDIPGGDGSIDLSEAVTGYPVYADRTGSLRFTASREYSPWKQRFAEIKEYLHGRRMRMTLEDDPGWFWEGRFTVRDIGFTGFFGVIEIDYDLGPFKWYITATDEPWLWDPFSFFDGVIGNGTFAASFSASASVTTTAQELAYTAQQTGEAFFNPDFTVTGNSDVQLVIKSGDETRATVTLEHGETASVPRLALQSGRWLYKLEPVRVFVSTASGTAELGVAAAVSYRGAGLFADIAVENDGTPLVYRPGDTGSAPLKVSFAAGAGKDILLDVSRGSAALAQQTVPGGAEADVPGLVLYRGVWLYNGRAAEVTAYPGGSDSSSSPTVTVTGTPAEPAHFTDAIAAPAEALSVGDLAFSQAGSGDPAPDNIRAITPLTGVSVYSSGADTGDPAEIAVDWETDAGEIGGGTLNVLTGMLTITHKYLSFTGDETWTAAGTGSVAYLRYKLSNENEQYIVTTEVDSDHNVIAAHGVCSHFACSDIRSNQTDVGFKLVHTNTNKNTLLIRTGVEGVTTANDMKTWVAAQALNGTPLQIVYELLTPETVQLEAHTLSTLAGENNIWPGSGTVTVTYRRGTDASLTLKFRTGKL